MAEKTMVAEKTEENGCGGRAGRGKVEFEFLPFVGVRKTRRVGEIRTARLPAPPFPPDFRAPQPSPRQSEVTSERAVIGYPPWVARVSTRRDWSRG